MQPIILITVYRRYHELIKNIEQVITCGKEFTVKPLIFVIWVNPELGRIWIFKKLLSEHKIDHVISRVTDNTHNISYEESRNIRKGLEFARDHYKNAFFIVQTADISPNQKTYAYIQQEIDNGMKAVLFHLDNHIVHFDIWHTNFFATADEKYWPPISQEGEADILESQWGKHLKHNNLCHFAKSHNYNAKKFIHCHESEGLPPVDFIPLKKSLSVDMYVKGKIYFWRKVWRLLKLNLIQRPKNILLWLMGRRSKI